MSNVRNCMYGVLAVSVVTFAVVSAMLWQAKYDQAHVAATLAPYTYKQLLDTKKRCEKVTGFVCQLNGSYSPDIQQTLDDTPVIYHDSRDDSF
jgi:hypothetical protein